MDENKAIVFGMAMQLCFSVFRASVSLKQQDMLKMTVLLQFYSLYGMCLLLLGEICAKRTESLNVIHTRAITPHRFW